MKNVNLSWTKQVSKFVWKPNVPKLVNLLVFRLLKLSGKNWKLDGTFSIHRVQFLPTRKRGFGAMQKTNRGNGCLLWTTPFYAESGGQVADQGTIQQGQRTWSVVDVRKEGDLIIHVCDGSDKPEPEPVIARIDVDKRKATTRNHTGTHMLHAALKQIIGQHVNQAGSIVHPDYLRFDFTHSERLSSDQVEEIERLVNRKIRENIYLNVFETGYESGWLDSGVTALFGEKYGDTVRVVQLDDFFSSELCGGCHTSATRRDWFLPHCF